MIAQYTNFRCSHVAYRKLQLETSQVDKLRFIVQIHPCNATLSQGISLAYRFGASIRSVEGYSRDWKGWQLVLEQREWKYSFSNRLTWRIRSGFCNTDLSAVTREKCRDVLL